MSNGGNNPQVVLREFGLDPVEVDGNVRGVRVQAQVVAGPWPAFDWRVAGDIIEMEDSTSFKDGANVGGEIMESFSSSFRFDDVSDFALQAESQVFVIGALPLAAGLEEQPFVQFCYYF